jgi:Zn-dependent protease with chaperone function/DNA-directed RNA polymerase subunit RPC12/RpoP
MEARWALMQSVAHLKPEAQSVIANWEAYLYARHISSSLLVGEDQLSELYGLLKEACQVLDLPVPLLFVENSSAINAWASGSKLTFMALTSGLVEKFDQDETLAVIGHELGHIKGQHMYCKAVAENAQTILAVQAEAAAALESTGFWLTSILGAVQGAAVSGAATKLANALFQWSRVAEFTADRASLLVTQDLDVTINVMAKLASGLNRRFNQQAFMKQAEYFRTFGAASGDYYRQMVIHQDTHPLLVLRAEELRNWAGTDAYMDLTNPRVKSAEIRLVCGGCGQGFVVPISLSGQNVHCPACGIYITVPGVAAPPIMERRADITTSGPATPPPIPKGASEPASWTVCTCNVCSGHLEFETSNTGATIQCPHCGMETVLFVPQVPLGSSAPAPQFPPLLS